MSPASPRVPQQDAVQAPLLLSPAIAGGKDAGKEGVWDGVKIVFTS